MKNYKLGNFICTLREDAEMDQKTLAALLGVSASAISQCENGGGIKTEKLFQLSELFGVTLDELLRGARTEQPITERLDELYFIDEGAFEEAVNNSDYESIIKLFQRIKLIRERFEELIYKRIFAKITTDETSELKYLMSYYNQNLYNSPYFTQTIVFFEEDQRYKYIKETLLKTIGSNNRKNIAWELNKIFSLKLDLHLQEVLKLLSDDKRIETEQNCFDCFTTVFSALPSLSKDLLFSQIVYNDDSFNMKLSFIKSMLEQGAKPLFSPAIKNMTHVDEDVIVALEGNTEYAQKLTDIVAIYHTNFVNSFEYKDFIRLTLDEYQECINADDMRDLFQLVNLWQDDKIDYWNKFKTVKFYHKLS